MQSTKCGIRSNALAVVAVVFGLLACAREAPAAPPLPVPPPDRLETVTVTSDRAPVLAGDRVVATVEKGRLFGVIERRGDLAAVQVCVGNELRPGWLRASDVKFLTDGDIDLAAEWLKMSKGLNPAFDLPAYRAKLDALVGRAAAAAAAGRTPREQARLLATQLFEREGLQFTRDVFRPEAILDLKQGNCLSLSVLYLCIAKRLRMPLHLVRVPTHAFVRYELGGERFNIETTTAGALHDGDGYLPQFLGKDVLRHAGGIYLASLPHARAVGEIVLEWGVLLRGPGKGAEECEKAARALEINPRQTEAYCNWGFALASLGKTAEAYAKYAKALEINPCDAIAYYNWGTTLGNAGQHAEACAKHAKAVDLDPSYADAYCNWGNSLAALGRPTEAFEKFAQALQSNPRHADTYYGWGYTLEGTGHPVAACEKYAKAVELNPRLVGAYRHWGSSLAGMGLTAQACEKYAKAVEIEPRDAMSYYGWGTVLGNAGQHAEACEKYAKAVELEPNYAEAYGSWGNSLVGLRRPAEACEKFAKAVQTDPRLARAYYNWGNTLASMGRTAEAIEKCNKAAELDPAFRPRVEELRGQLEGKK